MRKASQYLGVLVLLVLAHLPFAVVAQGTFMVPPGFENTEGDFYQPILFGRQQELIRLGSAGFPGLPPAGVILNAMSWRINRSPGPAPTGSSFSLGQCEISLSTEPIEVIGDYYRPGSDRTVVFSGPLAFTYPTPASKPAPFNITVSFTQPFFYKPGTPLLIDMLAGDRSPLMDAALVSGTQLLYFTGGIPDGGPPWILQFGYAVPEPCRWTLLLLGTACLSVLRKRGQP